MKTKETREMIRTFIMEKQGTATKNDVIKHMEKYSSRVPTLDMIKEFEDAGIIQVQKGDRRGQAHYLMIDEKSEYNRIDKQLSSIESFMDKTEKSYNSILSFAKEEPSWPEDMKGKKRYPDIYDIYWEVAMNYERIVQNILRCLLFRIKVVPAEKRQPLYTKTIELMERLDRSLFYKDWLYFFNDEIDTIIGSYSYSQEPWVAKYGKKGPEVAPLYDILMEKIENFKKEFLLKEQ